MMHPARDGRNHLRTGSTIGVPVLPHAPAVPSGELLGLHPLPAHPAKELDTSPWLPEVAEFVPLLSRLTDVVQHLKLPSDMGKRLREDLLHISKCCAADNSADPSTGRQVFIKALLVAPEIQDLRVRYDREVVPSLNPELHPAQLSLIGAIYLWSKLSSVNPGLAAELLRGYTGEPIDWSNVIGDLKRSIRTIAAPQSAITQLFVRQYEARTGVSEQAFVAGFCAPLLSALKQEAVSPVAQFLQRLRSFLRPPPPQVATFACGEGVSYTAARELSDLYAELKPRAREDDGVDRISFEKADPVLLLVLNSGFGSSLEDKRTILRGLWERVSVLETYGEEDLALLLTVAKEMAATGVGVPSGMRSARQLLEELPLNERRSTLDDLSLPLPVELAMLVRGLALVSPKAVQDADKLERVAVGALKHLTECLSASLPEEISADLVHALKRHHLKTIQQIHIAST